MGKAFVLGVVFVFGIQWQALAHPVGELFLVDHYSSAKNATGAHSIYSKWISDYDLGGIVFWNADKKSYKTFQTMTNVYKRAAFRKNKAAPILTIDHEGGRVQRLLSRHGFTNLVKPAILGNFIRSGSFEICRLHGKIMTEELKAAGLNSSLGTPADLYVPGSGTSRMLDDRAVSSDIAKVGPCLQSIYKGSLEASSFLFVSKHFPGLGYVNGNTDNGLKTSRGSKMQELVALQAFIDLGNYAKSQAPYHLGFMISNAIYPNYDKKNPAPQSPEILNQLLRRELRFAGLSVSDALWLGQYSSLSKADFRVALAGMVLSGMDMLMIPAQRFSKLYTFMRSFYRGEIDSYSVKKLKRRYGYRSKRELVAAFKDRVDESVKRIRATKRYLKSDVVAEGIEPRAVSRSSVQRYVDILKGVSKGKSY